MNSNLDKIAQDLYGKIQTRFTNINIGDENANVLSKKDEQTFNLTYFFDVCTQPWWLGGRALV